MSFWDTVGHMADTAAKAANPLLGVFDAARVAAATENPADGPDSMLDNAKQFGASFFKDNIGTKVMTSEPVNSVMAPLNWTMNQASHGIAATGAVGGMLAASGQTGIDNLWSADLWDGDTWSKAWDATDGVSGGEALAYDQMQMLNGGNTQDAGKRWWDPKNRQDFEDQRKKTGFRVGAGALDIITTWYADPTLVVGKAAKAARAGSRIVDAAQADEVAKVVADIGGRSAGAKVAGTFSTSADETASRMWEHVSKTDNMDINQTAAHFKQNLERSGDAGPIVGILGQAGKIEDLQLQRQVKVDALLTAAGSQVARDRLMKNAPHIARAVQRASLPPESFQIVDGMVESGVTGQALLDAAGKWASKGNEKELGAYAKELDNIHARIAGVTAVGARGGVEQVGGSVLGAVKSRYRSGMASEFYFQPGPHSRTVRVLHWATGQRMRGVIATDDAVRGHDELMDTLVRSKLFTAEQRKAVSEKWWQAPDQAARSNMAQALPEVILNKLASKHFEGDRKLLDETIQSYRGWSEAARTYTTKQMEKARAEEGTRVVLEDPLTGTPTSIDRALFETHIENHVAIPDVALLERMVRHAKDGGTLSDKVKKSGEWALKSAENANDLWRTMTLARPGFVVRTQLDTQARVAMTVGASSIVRNAMAGLGHKIGDRLNGEQVVKVEALASDLLRQETLRREAAGLRAKADGLIGDAGKRLHERATALEAEAAKTVTYDANARRLITQEKTLNIRGQKVTTRAAASDAEAQALVPALHTGDMTIGDAITQIQGKYQMQYAENANSWVTTMPDDRTWAASWLRSKDSMVQSKAGRKIMETLDEPNVDMVRHLRNDADVQSAWRAVREQNPHFDSWLERAIAQVEWTAPTTAIRDVLRSGKVLKQADVEAMFKPASAVSEKEAAKSAQKFAEHEAALKPQIDKAREAVARNQAKADKARRGDTQAAHQEKADRAQARLDKLQAKLDSKAPKQVAEEHAHLADRMPVHAPALDVLDPTTNGIEKATDLARKLVRIMADQPDTVLGRVPFYREKYFAHYKELAGREIDRSGELGLEARARIEKVARHRAIQDTRQTMYDTARFTGAHDRVARLGFSFIGAWEDSMRAWGRMFYDDPAMVGKLGKVWYSPERGGLVVDEAGNRVTPGEKVREKWIVLPVSWIPGVDFQDMKIRKDSFNSMFQGDVPWLPGLGPGVQVPITQIAARTFPELADPNFEIGGYKVGNHPILRQVFGFGLPKTGVGAKAEAGSVLEQVEPGWIRRALNIVDGDSQQFNDAYSMALNTELIKAREAGKDPSSKAVIDAADRVARKTARSMMVLEFAANYGLGMSGEGSTKADFYRQRYREISANAEQLAQRGTTPQEEMLRQHPEAAGLDWSFSENATGINASLKVEDRVRKYGKDIQKNPEFGWFFVGSDNVGGEFSAASYAAQYGREAAPGSGQAWRSRKNSAEIRQSTAASLGWNEYYKVKDQVDSILLSRGLHSLQQKGAEDLNAVMKGFRSDLAAENPDWSKDYSSFDSSKMQTFLTQVAEPALKDGRLKNRSDIKAMGEYLALRDQASKIAESNGYSLGSAKARDLREVLIQAGTQMAQENIGFGQMWQRVFEREVDVAQDSFPAAPTQAASAVKY